MRRFGSWRPGQLTSSDGVRSRPGHSRPRDQRVQILRCVRLAGRRQLPRGQEARLHTELPRGSREPGAGSRAVGVLLRRGGQPLGLAALMEPGFGAPAGTGRPPPSQPVEDLVLAESRPGARGGERRLQDAVEIDQRAGGPFWVAIRSPAWARMAAPASMCASQVVSSFIGRTNRSNESRRPAIRAAHSLDEPETA